MDAKFRPSHTIENEVVARREPPSCKWCGVDVPRGYFFCATCLPPVPPETSKHCPAVGRCLAH